MSDKAQIISNSQQVGEFFLMAAEDFRWYHLYCIQQAQGTLPKEIEKRAAMLEKVLPFLPMGERILAEFVLDLTAEQRSRSFGIDSLKEGGSSYETRFSGIVFEVDPICSNMSCFVRKKLSSE